MVGNTETASQVPVTEELRLRGSMGVGELVMSVLAFASPLATVAGTMPVLIMFSGKTTPGIYIIMTVMLLIFSVGFVKMSRTIENPGGFYSFVTAGLGKPAGLGGAFLALIGYLFIGFFAPPFFAVTLQGFVAKTLHGPQIPWYWYALAIIAVTTFLAYCRIDLSAKVLTVAMILEVVIIIVFDVASFLTSSEHVAQGIGFSMPWLTDGGIGLALLFAFGNFLGFEATVIFRDEVKDPNRTIPRATYLAVAGIGVFYVVAAWAYVVFLGADRVQEAARANTVGLFNSSAEQLLGTIFADVTSVLLITSVLATMLSTQNVAARYSFSLATDGALPKVLGRVHKRHRSPYISALTSGILWVVATIVFTVLGVGPDVLYPIASGSGTFCVLLLMFVVSIAVLVHFLRRRRRNPESLWNTVLAPAISMVFLGAVTYLAIMNYSELIDGSTLITVILMAFTFALFVGGFLYALYLRKKRPETYAKLGREKV
ncbi:APC family permease [Streptomyces sp. NPDC042319]|uniref:APC family permease n=1 Tax=Streptomyces sp. NPDC042319 TaxID=3154332 RepID=UPI003400A48A